VYSPGANWQTAEVAILFDLSFRPLPGLGNPHAQTILGTLWSGRVRPLQSRTHLVRLRDGDSLLLYDSVPAGWTSAGWAALVLHGLGGSHQSGTVRRMTAALLAEGFRVARVNLRGAGTGLPFARRLYHGGCSDDARAAAEFLAGLAPHTPLVLIGFSLGGNVALKLAGEAALHPLPGLGGVAAISAPLDMPRCCAMLARPGNRFYDRWYTGKLTNQVRRHRRIFADLPAVSFPRGLTLREFDDTFTAPAWGFADALDYYRKASSLTWVPQIRVPAYLVTSRDDPFIAVESFEDLPAREGLTVQIAECGGHLGFLGDDGAGGVRWAERRVLDWALRLRGEVTAR
jgi:predicted alpha/beta-fold hydrolase